MVTWFAYLAYDDCRKGLNGTMGMETWFTYTACAKYRMGLTGTMDTSRGYPCESFRHCKELPDLGSTVTWLVDSACADCRRGSYRVSRDMML